MALICEQAFRKLGFKLNAFLFSPFGRRILKDVLAFHVVKDVTFFSDFNINATAAATSTKSEMPHNDRFERPSKELREVGMLDGHQLLKRGKSFLKKFKPSMREVKVSNYYLTTLFNNTVLPVDVYETRVGPFGKGPLRRSIWLGWLKACSKRSSDDTVRTNRQWR